MYRIAYLKPARKALLKMPRNQAMLIRSKIEAMAQAPHAANNNITPLTGRDASRLRVGDWRVIFERHDDQGLIAVIDIGPRGSIYA
ncbi:MAG: type II toxin-antitoxin system RelE/ParE family toxin [Salinisphaera sp.]|nr:type II toxin-antitoxin system RelE/ParE family toxin [Salinisphaera sp.]